MFNTSNGEIAPSVILSPALTSIPSVTTRRSPTGTKYSLKSFASVVDFTMITLIPFFFLPVTSIFPSMSVSIALPLGFLASNSSCTLGRPPVMSFVPAPSLMILAIVCPFLTSSPSLTIK